MTGLVGWWPLNEDSGSTAYDLSGNENHGTLNGGVTQGAAGKGGLTSYSFDASSGQWTEINGSSVFDVQNSITISVWAKPKYWNDKFRTIFSKGERANGDDISEEAWTLRQGRTDENDNIVIADIIIDGSRISLRWTPPDPEEFDGEWHHYVMSYDGESAHLLVDGDLVASENVTGNIGTNSSNLFVGRVGSSDDQIEYWNGEICNLRIYNRSLSPEEVQELYEMGNGDYARPLNDRNSSSAVSRWAFDGNADDSWGSNDGSLNGDASVGNSDSIRGGSLALDGSDDYVNCGQLSSLDGSAVTVSAWAKPQKGKSSNVTVVGSHGTDGYLLDFKKGGFSTFFYDSNGNRAELNVVGDFTLGKWYHIVGSCTTEGVVRYYSNGKLVEESSHYSFSGGINSTDPTYIGARPGNSDNFKGRIDDVRIYDKALSPSEVFELYRWGTRGRDMRKLTVNSR